MPARSEVPAPKQRPRAAGAPGSSRSPSVRVRGLTNVVRETRMQWDPGPLRGRIVVATAACRPGSVWVCQRAGLLLSGRGCPPLHKAWLRDGTGRRFGSGARVRTDVHGGGAGYPRVTDTLVRGRPWGRGVVPRGPEGEGCAGAQSRGRSLEGRKRCGRVGGASLEAGWEGLCGRVRREWSLGLSVPGCPRWFVRRPVRLHGCSPCGYGIWLTVSAGVC